MKHGRCAARRERVFTAEFLTFRQCAARKWFLVATQVVVSLRLAMATDGRGRAKSFAADKFSTKRKRLKNISMRGSAEVSRRFPRGHLPNRALIKAAV